MGTIGGPILLGTYSIASSLARSIGDSLSASNANFLRADLVDNNAHVLGTIRSRAEAILRRGLILASASAAVSVALATFVAKPLMDAAWDPALQIVPVLSLAVLPGSLASSGAVLQAITGSAWRSLWSPVVGIAFAPVVAIVATKDLEMAAWLVLLRELAVVTTSFWLVRTIAPWRSLRLCVVLLVIFALAVAVIS